MADTASRGFTELTPEEERLKIRDISLAAESQSKEGETFYLITQRWWQQWLDYVNQDKINLSNDVPVNPADSGGCASKRPSTIDNSDLIDDTPMKESSSTELHDTLVEGRDYILLPHEVWDQLKTWYGGGPTLPRKVINSGLSQMELAVEVYPLRLKLVLMPKGDKATIRISKKENIGELHRKACEIFDLNSEQVCIWDFYGHQKHALYDMDKTLDDANIQMDQDILVEVVSSVSSSASGDMLENGSSGKETSSRLLEPPKSSLSIAGGLSASNGAPKNSNSELKSQNSTASVKETDHVSGTPGVTTRGAIGGLTGLLNLGNTCFMNSAIQCLVHTPEFAKYFQEDYHQEINWQNPLGMVGELALAFGDLLRKLWAPGRTPIAPRPFKAKLARFAPQFSGYQQHDSQELLAFLLDGLHEDLNRVKHKPYMKSRDADGRPDEEVADEYWANHRARNDSIIVDVCQGQYKSTLVCPDCGKVSVTFDPFMYLSLPLQSPVTRPMTVTVFSTDGSALPNVCTVNVPKQGKCRDLLQALGTSCGLKSTEKLLLTEIRNHLIHRFFEDPLTPLASIKDDDHLAAYKVSKVAKDVLFLHLIHRREDLESNTEGSRKGWKPYGTPLVLPVSYKETITRGDVQSLVRTTLSPLTRKDRGGATNSSLGDVLKTAELSQDTSETSTNSGEHSLASEKDLLGTLPLELVDENNTCVDLKIGEEKSIKFSSSSSMLVFIDWSQKLLEKYDTHYLENLREVAKNGVPSKKARSEPLSLYTCLEAFLREEPLVPEDMWFCPQCKEQRQASKKLDLWRLPEVLVIHLKRFSYSRSMKHKLETYVNFPVHDFDLTKYITSKNNSDHQLYELYALINHYGGMGSGHYTAHIKLLEENKWYNFDDNHISAMIEDEVKSSAAYVLFYRRVRRDDNLPPPIPKIKPQLPPSHKPPSRK